jgi:hypothetical protein
MNIIIMKNEARAMIENLSSTGNQNRNAIL